MSRKKVSITTYIEAEQLVELRALVARTRIPMAVHIRDAIEDMLRAKLGPLSQAGPR